MRITVRVDGDVLLLRRLRALGAVARGHVIAQAIEAGGRVCEGYAKILAPVDLGTLRASIETRPGAIRSTSANVHVGPAVHYGPFVEFGTGLFAEGGKGRRTPWVYYSDRLGRFVRTRGSRPRPYLRPALRGHKSEIIGAVMATVRRLVDVARAR